MEQLNSICLAFVYICTVLHSFWSRNQTVTVASASTVTGSVLILKFGLFLGQCTNKSHEEVSELQDYPFLSRFVNSCKAFQVFLQIPNNFCLSKSETLPYQLEFMFLSQCQFESNQLYGTRTLHCYKILNHTYFSSSFKLNYFLKPNRIQDSNY